MQFQYNLRQVNLASLVTLTDSEMCFRRYALEALRVSYMYRGNSDLELRRTSLTVALTSVIILTRKSNSSKQRPVAGRGGVLASLTSIHASLGTSDDGDDGDSAHLDASELEVVMTMCEWVVSSSASDSDDQSRLIKQLIVQSVHNALKS